MCLRVFVSVLKTRIITVSAVSGSMREARDSGKSPRVSAFSTTRVSRWVKRPGAIAFSKSFCHVPKVSASYFPDNGQPDFSRRSSSDFSCLRWDSEYSIAIMCGILCPPVMGIVYRKCEFVTVNLRDLISPSRQIFRHLLCCHKFFRCLLYYPIR